MATTKKQCLKYQLKMSHLSAQPPQLPLNTQTFWAMTEGDSHTSEKSHPGSGTCGKQEPLCVVNVMVRQLEGCRAREGRGGHPGVLRPDFAFHFSLTPLELLFVRMTWLTARAACYI